MGHARIILFIILGLAAVAGLVFIFPFFLSFTSKETGHSHGPPTTPEEIVSEVTIPEGTSSSNSQLTFGPQKIEVTIGTNNRVRWINFDFARMSVLADDNSDPGFFNATHLNGSDNPTAASSLYNYENFEYIFTKAGTYNYHCKFHPWMHGIVAVSPATG